MVKSCRKEKAKQFETGRRQPKPLAADGDLFRRVHDLARRPGGTTTWAAACAIRAGRDGGKARRVNAPAVRRILEAAARCGDLTRRVKARRHNGKVVVYEAVAVKPAPTFAVGAIDHPEWVRLTVDGKDRDAQPGLLSEINAMLGLTKRAEVADAPPRLADVLDRLDLLRGQVDAQHDLCLAILEEVRDLARRVDAIAPDSGKLAQIRAILDGESADAQREAGKAA